MHRTTTDENCPVWDNAESEKFNDRNGIRTRNVRLEMLQNIRLSYYNTSNKTTALLVYALALVWSIA